MIKLSYTDEKQRVREEETTQYLNENFELLEQIKNGEEAYLDSLGWLDPVKWAKEESLIRLERLAGEIREDAEVFIVVGVGGSNNAARAVIKALHGEQGKPRILYGGNSLSPHEINGMLEELKGKSVYINVIAKNFETLEPGVGFRVLRRFMEKAYGKEVHKRIIVTGTRGSFLQELCQKEEYAFLTFPEDVGGRYSALTDVGLFPMAVAGVDIRRLVLGARDMRLWLMEKSGRENPAFYYAAVRNQLYRCGYRLEMLSFFEPRYGYFSKWWTQLFAESEGKDGKGIYPVTAEYSEDLHSIGQFVQDGSPVIFETFLDMVNQDASCRLSPDLVEDGFDYLNDLDLWAVNQAAMEATVKAHGQKLPCFRITVDHLDAYDFGQLFYFFEFSCYCSGRLLGIHPFNQPGVEAYKGYMFQALKANAKA